MREIFWSFYSELYETKRYYWYYRKKDKIVDRCISGLLLLVSFAGIASWTIWDQYQLAWAIIIAVSQILSALTFWLPYARRVSAIDYMLPEIEDLLVDVELAWNDLVNGSAIEDRETAKLKHGFAKRKNAIIGKYAGSSDFMDNKWCWNKAEQDRIAYMKLTYGIDTPIV